jgi:hypothetical protein
MILELLDKFVTHLTTTPFHDFAGFFEVGSLTNSSLLLNKAYPAIPPPKMVEESECTWIPRLNLHIHTKKISP